MNSSTSNEFSHYKKPAIDRSVVLSAIVRNLLHGFSPSFLHPGNDARSSSQSAVEAARRAQHVEIKARQKGKSQTRPPALGPDRTPPSPDRNSIHDRRHAEGFAVPHPFAPHRIARPKTPLSEKCGAKCGATKIAASIMTLGLLRNFSFRWYPRPDSNRYARRLGILSPQTQLITY